MHGKIQVLTHEFLPSFDWSELKFVWQVIIYFDRLELDMTELKFVYF